MKGKIIKAISGFFYVHSEGAVWTCRARGILRNHAIKPLVGDNVLFEVTDGPHLEGSLTEVLKRRNMLIRPEVSNVDQALVVFAVKDPDPCLNLLDRYLIHMDQQKIPVVLLLNKSDLDRKGVGAQYRKIYENAGYDVILGSNGSEETINDVKDRLNGKTTVLAGPSGVGKSSLLNRLNQDAGAEIGELSAKIRRGKQTTRHTQLFTIGPDTYLLDTPGFTSLYINKISSASVQSFYPEFVPFMNNCRFAGCSHVSEPARFCAVKRAVEDGRIPGLRYENYCQIYAEVKDSEHRY